MLFYISIYTILIIIIIVVIHLLSHFSWIIEYERKVERMRERERKGDGWRANLRQCNVEKWMQNKQFINYVNCSFVVFFPLPLCLCLHIHLVCVFSFYSRITLPFHKFVCSGIKMGKIVCAWMNRIEQQYSIKSDNWEEYIWHRRFAKNGNYDEGKESVKT